MADDPNIQKLIFPVNTSTPGIVRTYTAEVNKKTGAMVVYDTTNLFQKDPILRDELTQTETEKVWLPSFLQDDLSNDEKDFILRSVRPQANNQRAAYINKNFTQEQKNNLFPGMPRVVNTAPPAPEITSGGTTVGADGEQQANLSEAIENLGRINDVEAKEFGELRYPIGSDTNGQSFNLRTSKTYLGFMGYNADYDPSAGPQLNNDVWHLIGATFDAYGSGTLKLYVDGANTANATLTLNTGPEASNIGYIGRSSHGGGNEGYFGGQVGQFMMYNRALSADEILQIFNSQRKTYGV